LDTHPTVIQVAHIKITRPFGNCTAHVVRLGAVSGSHHRTTVANLLIFMKMLGKEGFQLLFVVR